MNWVNTPQKNLDVNVVWNGNDMYENLEFCRTEVDFYWTYELCD